MPSIPHKDPDVIPYFTDKKPNMPVMPVNMHSEDEKCHDKISVKRASLLDVV